RFALKAGTARSTEIADFFIAALKVVQHYYLLSMHYDKRDAVQQSVENALTRGLVKDTKIVYLGDAGTNDNGEQLIKVGVTDDAPTRIADLKELLPKGFRLFHVERHVDNRVLERLFKAHQR
ncbi:hypothetical protein HDU87_003394, partial [Geranomyces variabilis]